MMNNKIKYLFFLLIFLFIGLSSSAKVGKLRMMYNKSAFSMTLAWVQESGKSPLVFYDSEKIFNKTHKLIKAITPSKNYMFKKMNNYFVNFDSLKANTIYKFVIKDSEGESQIFWFKTLPSNPSELSIVAGGDSRSNPNIRRLANKMVAKLQPDFVIFDGDYTFYNDSNEWKIWLDDWQLTISNGRIIPIVPVMGNHERGKVMPMIFGIPQNSYYSLDIADIIHISILNTNIDVSGNQKDWLNNDLKSINEKWKFVVYHKPMRPHYSKKREGDDIYNAWANVFFVNKVNIVLEGDTHVNKITYPIRPSQEVGSDEGFIRDDKNGTIYLGEGTWGAPLRPYDDSKSWTMDGASINQFKWIFVSKNKIQIRTVKYGNVDKVESLNFDNRFDIPQNIDLWKPLGKEFIEIIK